MRREPNTRKGPARPARDRSDRAFLSAEYVLYVMPRALRKTAFVRWLHPSILPAHSRSKNGVALLAYVAGIHVLMHQQEQRRGWHRISGLPEIRKY
jgi:hypothetical protein